MKKLTPFSALLVILIIMVAIAPQVKLLAEAALSKFSRTNSNSDLDSAYLKYANTISAKLPMMIDNETRLDGVMYEKRVLIMSYTVMNATGPVSEEQKAEFSSAMTVKLQKTLCSREQTQPLLNSGGAVKLSYFALDDSRLFDVFLDSAICKAAQKNA